MHDGGLETHETPLEEKVSGAASRLPKPVARQAIERVGIDRLAALHTAVAAVSRGGTLSISGVYGGQLDPMPMMDLFDKQIQIRMGQANVKAWIDDLMPLVTDDADPLGVDVPTVAMDVESRRAFWVAMRAFVAREKTVVFATHYLEEADAYADRVVLMATGAE